MKVAVADVAYGGGRKCGRIDLLTGRDHAFGQAGDGHAHICSEDVGTWTQSA